MLSKTQLSFLYFLSFFAISINAFAQNSASSRQSKVISRNYGTLGTLADLSVYYADTTSTANPAAGNSWQYSTSLYDFKVGYINENNIYFGAEVTGRNDTQISTSSLAGSSLGVGIGYFGYESFNLRAFYIFNETYGDYSNGSGFQFDLGYIINPSSSWIVGVALSTRQTTFKSNNTIANFSGWDRKETYPFISLGYLFK